MGKPHAQEPVATSMDVRYGAHKSEVGHYSVC